MSRLTPEVQGQIHKSVKNIHDEYADSQRSQPSCCLSLVRPEILSYYGCTKLGTKIWVVAVNAKCLLRVRWPCVVCKQAIHQNLSYPLRIFVNCNHILRLCSDTFLMYLLLHMLGLVLAILKKLCTYTCWQDAQNRFLSVL